MHLSKLIEAVERLRRENRLREPDDQLIAHHLEESFGERFIDAASNDYLGLAHSAPSEALLPGQTASSEGALVLPPDPGVSRATFPRRLAAAGKPAGRSSHSASSELDRGFSLAVGPPGAPARSLDAGDPSHPTESATRGPESDIGEGPGISSRTPGRVSPPLVPPFSSESAPGSEPPQSSSWWGERLPGSAPGSESSPRRGSTEKVVPPVWESGSEPPQGSSSWSKRLPGSAPGSESSPRRAAAEEVVPPVWESGSEPPQGSSSWSERLPGSAPGSESSPRRGAAEEVVPPVWESGSEPPQGSSSWSERLPESAPGSEVAPPGSARGRVRRKTVRGIPFPSSLPPKHLPPPGEAEAQPGSSAPFPEPSSGRADSHPPSLGLHGDGSPSREDSTSEQGLDPSGPPPQPPDVSRETRGAYRGTGALQIPPGGVPGALEPLPFVPSEGALLPQAPLSTGRSPAENSLSPSRPAVPDAAKEDPEGPDFPPSEGTRPGLSAFRPGGFNATDASASFPERVATRPGLSRAPLLPPDASGTLHRPSGDRSAGAGSTGSLSADRDELPESFALREETLSGMVPSPVPAPSGAQPQRSTAAAPALPGSLPEPGGFAPGRLARGGLAQGHRELPSETEPASGFGPDPGTLAGVAPQARSDVPPETAPFGSLPPPPETPLSENLRRQVGHFLMSQEVGDPLQPPGPDAVRGKHFPPGTSPEKKEPSGPPERTDFSPPASPQAGSPPTSPQAGSPPASPQAGSPPASLQPGSPPASPQAGSPPASLQAGSSPASPQAGSSPASPRAGSPPASPQAGTEGRSGAIGEGPRVVPHRAPGASPVSRETSEQVGQLRGRSALAPRIGAGASRLIFGTAPEHVRAERSVAHWLEMEEALLFTSGYAANVGALGALLSSEDAVFSDVLNHASLIDGIRLSPAQARVFSHLDLENLEAQLVRAAGAPARWVVVESYYSMDGDGPDLAALRALCDRHDAHLYVDEAHSVGTFGSEGRGLCSLAGVTPDVMMAGFGKALGLQGACILGRAPLRTWLWNRARSFVFSTAASPWLAGALEQRVARVRAMESERQRLEEVSRQVRRELGLRGVCLPAGSFGPVLSLVVGEEARALRLAAGLRDAGILAQAVRPPTVPLGESRIRLVLRSSYTDAQTERLAAEVARQMIALREEKA